MPFKRCSRCKENKSIASFNKNVSKHDGLNTYCKECQREYNSLYYSVNKVKIDHRVKVWSSSNKDKRNAHNKKWIEKNKDLVRSYKRRSQAKRSSSYHEPYTEADVIDRYGLICHICNTPIDPTAPRLSGVLGWELGLHFDHVVPLANGGADTIENVKPAHGLCNVKKKDKEFDSGRF